MKTEHTSTNLTHPAALAAHASDGGNFFALAHDFTARAEGGIGEHPADRGGLTAWGASIAFVRSIAGTAAGREFLHGLGVPTPVSREVMLGLLPGQVRQMFQREFWQGAGLDRLCAAGLALAPAMAIYDTAVNCGLPRAVRIAQQACNSLGAGQAGQGQLAVDGRAGPLTRAALLELGGSANPDAGLGLAKAILSARRAWYRAIVAARPGQDVFMRGWLARCDQLLAACQAASRRQCGPCDSGHDEPAPDGRKPDGRESDGRGPHAEARQPGQSPGLMSGQTSTKEDC